MAQSINTLCVTSYNSRGFSEEKQETIKTLQLFSDIVVLQEHFLLTAKSQKPKCCTAREAAAATEMREIPRGLLFVIRTSLSSSPSSSFEIRLISDIPCSSPKSGTEPYKSEGERAGSPSNATWILGGETASQRGREIQ